MTKQKKYDCLEASRFPMGYIRNGNITKETFKLGESKNISPYSNWMIIGRCTSGNGYIETEDAVHQYSAGDYGIILSNASCIVHSESQGDSVWELILVDEQVVGSSFSFPSKELFERMIGHGEAEVRIFHHLSKPEIGLTMHLLFEELENGGFMQFENIIGILQMLIIYIIRDGQGKETFAKKAKNSGLDFLLPSIQYIMDHYNETIRISTLAKLCYVSESYFRRVFSEYLHVSPSEYINQYRINKACELMKTTNYPIEMICSEVGFQSIATFYRNFKRLKGCKPSQWKNNACNPLA